MAVFMYMARIMGAGPLMVMDTEVDGAHEVEARVELLHVVERGDGYAGIAGAPEDVGPHVRIFAVQRGGIESGGKARGLVARARDSGSGGWCAPARPRRRTCASDLLLRAGRDTRRRCTARRREDFRSSGNRGSRPSPRVSAARAWESACGSAIRCSWRRAPRGRARCRSTRARSRACSRPGQARSARQRFGADVVERAVVGRAQRIERGVISGRRRSRQRAAPGSDGSLERLQR